MQASISKLRNVASILSAVAVLFLSDQVGRAKIIDAASCQFTDVSNAVAAASVGDTVQLAAGTNSWSQTLILSNGVSLEGAGTNATEIIDEEPRSGGAQTIVAYCSPGYLTEISNIQFAGGVTNTTMSYNGSVSINGVPGSSWRIDHNAFNGLYSKGIATYGSAFCVIDDNTFYERAISIADYSAFPNDGEGDVSYSQPPTYGLNSSNVLYIENNYMTNLEGYVASVGACDGCGGARMVFRYNTVWNDCFNNHGTETGGIVRGERSFEIYGNSFNFSANDPVYPCFAAMLIRSGGGVIFSNTCTGYSALVALRDFRSTDSFCGEWDPFCGANGVCPYDSNSPTLYLSGVSTGPSGSTYLQVAGANWTPNQWTGYTLMNLSSGLFSVVLSNTSNTMTYIGSTPQTASLLEHTAMTFDPGDPFQLHMVYAALDQPGRGSGDLLQDEGLETSGTLYSELLNEFAGFLNISLTVNGIDVQIDTNTGVPSYPNQALDPIYSWSNTTNGSLAEMSSPYPGIQQGRDFYNDTPKPGYTPFVYPHPLDIGTNNGGGGNTNTTNNLLPPSHLQFNGSTNL